MADDGDQEGRVLASLLLLTYARWLTMRMVSRTAWKQTTVRTHQPGSPLQELRRTLGHVSLDGGLTYRTGRRLLVGRHVCEAGYNRCWSHVVKAVVGALLRWPLKQALGAERVRVHQFETTRNRWNKNWYVSPGAADAHAKTGDGWIAVPSGADFPVGMVRSAD